MDEQEYDYRGRVYDVLVVGMGALEWGYLLP